MRQIQGVENAAASLTLPYERALNLGARWVGAKPGAEAIPIMISAEKIPNNVNLSGNKRLQRALEHWQPKYIQWWRDMHALEHYTQVKSVWVDLNQ